jgi:hypothetical protein
LKEEIEIFLQQFENQVKEKDITTSVEIDPSLP